MSAAIQFLNTLDYMEIGKKDGRTVYKLDTPLRFRLNDVDDEIPAGFETDLASVPRLPIVFLIWGDRAHREAVFHDWGYRKDCPLGLSKEDADWYFREAMIGRGNPWYIYHPMYLAVRFAGTSSYHRMNVMDHFELDEKY